MRGTSARSSKSLCMAERHEVLAALTRALSDSGDELRLQFVAPDRLGRRSTIYFVGLQDAPARCRWVVKAPNSHVVREDLPPPASADVQFAALARAAEHLASASDQLATPRPVALLPEIDAYAMAYVSGESLSRRIRMAAVVRPAHLLEGVAAAASIIRSLHGLEPAREMSIDLRTAVRRSLERSRAALERVGLPAPFAAPLDSPEPTAVMGKEVLLTRGLRARERIAHVRNDDMPRAGPGCQRSRRAGSREVPHYAVRGSSVRGRRIRPGDSASPP